MGYIYKIINDINDKVYIGQTQRSIQERWKEHLKESNDTRMNHPIYRAMRKYGNEHFSIIVVEEIENNQLDEREVYWIQQYNSYKDGYNATLGGSGKRIDYTEVYQLWQEGKLLKEIAEITSHKRDTISQVLKEQYGVTQLEIYHRAGDTHHNNLGTPYNNRGFCHPHAVYQLDKNTNEIIQYFSTIRDAANALGRENVHATSTCISNVCKGKKITAYGYKWKYADK